MIETTIKLSNKHFLVKSCKAITNQDPRESEKSEEALELVALTIDPPTNWSIIIPLDDVSDIALMLLRAKRILMESSNEGESHGVKEVDYPI